MTAATEQRLDIAELLEAEGSELSLRAARHIRIKWQTEEGLRQQLRRLQMERHEHEQWDAV